MIHNKCANPFFKIQKGYFPKLDANDSLKTHCSLLQHWPCSNLLYNKETSPPFSNHPNSCKDILTARKFTYKPWVSSKRYKFNCRNSSRKTKSYYQIPHRHPFAACFKEAASTWACHCGWLLHNSSVFKLRQFPTVSTLKISSYFFLNWFTVQIIHSLRHFIGFSLFI